MAMVSVGLPVIGWLVSPVIDKLMDHGILHFKQRSRLEKSVQEEVDRLGRVLPLVRGVLEDAEKKQSENSGVLSWLGELKEVLYDAEDLLDQYEVDLALMNQREVEPPEPVETGWKAKVSSRFSTLFSRQESSFDASVAKQMKHIRERLDDLCKLGHELSLREMATSTTPQGDTASVWKSRETTSLLADGSTIIGRDDEKSAIINILLSDDGEKKLVVLPIIGTGGVGKTTLVRLVFNAKDVEAFFKSRVWICVGMSQDLDLKRIIKEIIASVSDGRKGREDYDRWSLESLQCTLVNEIKDQGPFMLVLDDAWDAKSNHWDKIFEPLKVAGIICKIIITTRHQKVADAIRWDRCKPMYLDFLKEEYMWSIFKRHACGGDDAVLYPELEAIGRNIVQKIKGLPLAAQTIGGILHGSKDAAYWRSISGSRLLEIQHDENYMLPILMLSYNNLPVLLKRCFSYFSLFPKDYEFWNYIVSYEYPTYPKDHVDINDIFYSYYFFDLKDIFYQWMAQKFIQRQSWNSAIGIGAEIITEFVNRSLLQYDKFRSITIHDSVHDLAEMVAKEEFLRWSDNTTKQLPKKLRHISFFHENSSYFENSEADANMLWDLKECKTLRTLIFHKYYISIINSSCLLDGWFDSLRCLRTLSLHNYFIVSLPDSIGNLKLLSFLDLYLPEMEKLPETISCLYNLQVLDLVGCERLSRLPNSLTRLVNLVSLSIEKQLENFKNIGRLTNLQKLNRFHVKRQDGHKVTELKNLNGLCGSLRILRLENIEGNDEVRQAHLDRKDGLEWLTLSWSNTASGGQEQMQVGVLEGLCPNTNLKKLSIDGYLGMYPPSWLDSKYLPLLKFIELKDCSKLNFFRNLTGKLEGLNISNCPELVEIPLLPPTLQHLMLLDVGVASLMPSPSTSQALPSLRRLKVDGCINLDESLNTLLKCSLPSLDSLYISNYSCPLEVLSHLTTLSKIKLDNCSEKVVINVEALISLRGLEIYECPNATIDGSQSNSTLCSSLRQLFIKESPLLLKSLCQRVLLPSLKKLKIKADDLDEFILFECLDSVTALEELSICYCSNIRLISEEVLNKLVLLRTCKISCCGRLVDLDLQALRSLKYLKLVCCPNLVFKRPLSSSNPLLEGLDLKHLSAEQMGGLFSIPLEYPSLDSLRKLGIYSCAGVTSLPILKSLGTLQIVTSPDVMFRVSHFVPFPLLKILGLYCDKKELTRLILLATGSPVKTLIIGGCDDLIQFDGDLELPFLSLTSLQWLYIYGCNHLQELPLDLQGFKDLRFVIISECPQMWLLPEGLPTSLREIHIQGCPMLEERYGHEKEGNTHWQRISHIPHVRFYSDEEGLGPVFEKMTLASSFR